jgi:hypothetical protein
MSRYLRPLSDASGLRFSVVRVLTVDTGAHPLTSATGFFFERGHRLHLVTSRHVVSDRAQGHAPAALEFWVHAHEHDLSRCSHLHVPLYGDGGRRALWRQATDGAGAIDVAVIPLPDDDSIEPFYASPFTASQLPATDDALGIGDALLIPGFPLGFFDTVHHLPVSRHATVASEYGVRFQGQGYFLTDSRTHSGSSGAPVLQRVMELSGQPGWRLVGIHSSRMDMASRNPSTDESLGLNCAWYADVLLALTADEDEAACEPACTAPAACLEGIDADAGSDAGSDTNGPRAGG